MDLRQLTYFVAVSEAGGIRAAARRLEIAQPPVSQALRRLEAELGVTLMRRGSRGIELTPEGEELLVHAREILDRVGAVRGAVKRAAEQRPHVLRIGLVSGVISAGELVAPIMAAYGEACPEQELVLSEISFCDQVSPVLDGSVDVVVVRGPVVHPELEVTAIAQEPRYLLVGASHELAGEDRVHVDDVLAFPTLTLGAPEDWSAFWQLDDFRGGANRDEHVAPAGTVPEVQLAVATQGVVVSTPGAVARLAPNPLIKAVEIVGASPAVISVARRRRDAGPAARRFVTIAQETAERHIDMLPAGAVPR